MLAVLENALHKKTSLLHYCSSPAFFCSSSLVWSENERKIVSQFYTICLFAL